MDRNLNKQTKDLKGCWMIDLRSEVYKWVIGCLDINRKKLGLIQGKGLDVKEINKK